MRRRTVHGAVPPASVPAPQPAAAVPVDPSRRVAARDFMVSIWGATDRKGSWTPARTITSLSIMGGAGLDFRDATFGTDEVNVRVVAVMGGAEIIVPPGVRVEWNGVAIMGGVDIGEPVEPPGPDAPVIRVTGLVCMGSVEVVERERGETAKEARKRRRALRKARRRLAAESQD